MFALVQPLAGVFLCSTEYPADFSGNLLYT